jgi:hypothetical protein
VHFVLEHQVDALVRCGTYDTGHAAGDRALDERGQRGGTRDDTDSIAAPERLQRRVHVLCDALPAKELGTHVIDPRLGVGFVDVRPHLIQQRARLAVLRDHPIVEVSQVADRVLVLDREQQVVAFGDEQGVVLRTGAEQRWARELRE